LAGWGVSIGEGGCFGCRWRLYFIDVGVFSKDNQEGALPASLVIPGPLSSEIKFKTYFTNCIQETLASRTYRQTEDDDWNIYWCEKEFIAETLDKIRLFPDRRINHFRNFYEICRKDLLSKNVKRYKKTLEREGKAEEAAGYDYLPLTYNMPSEYPIFAE
jgi:tubulin polyglutamylase TTLL9